MKKNNKGFVLAETLIVTVFLMVLFSMLYSNFYPLIGEYEKRENYDTVDGKYAVFWLKRIIEDSAYDFSINTINNKEYIRFQCKDVSEYNEQRLTCINLVKAMQVEGCDGNGNNCEIFITKYRLGYADSTSSFKTVIQNNKKRYEEDCSGDTCRQQYIDTCQTERKLPADTCTEEADSKIFKSRFRDYVETLPDYATASLNDARYRVIAVFHNKKDNNNYYSYATIEVNR